MHNDCWYLHHRFELVFNFMPIPQSNSGCGVYFEIIKQIILHETQMRNERVEQGGIDWYGVKVTTSR